jgi:NADH-quinone oxidoreductase subunit N
MIVGTVVGVAQTSVKRMLAYSSIAHAGYLLWRSSR